MENELLSQLIKTALTHFDEQNTTYKNLIKTENINIQMAYDYSDLNMDLIIFNNKDEFDFELLGYFDNQTNIWIWAWVLPNLDYNKIILSKELLQYGLSLEPSSNSIEHFILKSWLVNSRIILENNIQLENFLALLSYILKNNSD